jgi:hypothetical protein
MIVATQLSVPHTKLWDTTWAYHRAPPGWARDVLHASHTHTFTMQMV